MKSKVTVITAVKLPVKNTPHTINAADNPAVTQNTDPVPENIFCTLCIRKTFLPQRFRLGLCPSTKSYEKYVNVFHTLQRVAA